MWCNRLKWATKPGLPGIMEPSPPTSPILCKGDEMQGEQAQVEDSGDKGQHAHHHRKVCQKMMIRELLMWKKPPEALEVEELGCKASWPDQRTFWLTP